MECTSLMESQVTRMPALLLTAALGVVSSSASALAQASDEAADLVATQVREQGHDCSEPFEAAPDPKDSEVGERGWILTCANASYRVRLIPDMAAKVELID